MKKHIVLLFCLIIIANLFAVENTNTALFLNNMEYEICKSSTVNNKRIVDEAITKIKIADNEYTLRLNNFEVNNDQSINHKQLIVSCIDSENQTVDSLFDGTTRIDISSIQMTNDGKLYSDSAIHKWNNLVLSGIILTAQDFEYNNAKTTKLKPFSFNGFTITPEIVNFSKDKIIIKNGYISIYNEPHSFTNLSLATDGNTALETCNINGVFLSDDNDKNLYGAICTYSDLRIQGTKIIAKLNIPLPNKLTSSKCYFDNLVLTPDATNLFYAEVTDANYKINYGTYEIIADNIIFDGKSFTVKSGTVNFYDLDLVQDNKVLKSLPIANLSFNYNKCINNGYIDSKNLQYKFDGWTFNYNDKSLSLSDNGIVGSGLIELDNIEYLLLAYFEEFTLTSNGTVKSGLSVNLSTPITEMDNENTKLSLFIKNYYYMRINDTEFIRKNANSPYQLKCPKLIVEIETADHAELEFQDIVINSDSTISTSSKDQIVTFISSNGYEIETTSAILDNKGISLCGKLKLNRLDSTTTFTNYEMKLASNFVVLAESKDAITEYSYLNWKILGKGIKCHYQTIVINENTIEYKGKNILLGETIYNTDCELLEESYKEQNVNINIFSNECTVTEARFSEEGLFVEGYVHLPAPFEDHSIYFSHIHLDQDGTYYSQETIDFQELRVGALDFIFQDINLYPEGLEIEKFNVKTKEHQDISIDVESVRINNQGNFFVLNTNAGPFTYLDMTYYMDEFFITKDGMSLNGITILSQSFPGSLSGQRMKVNNFTLGLDGIVRNLDIKENKTSFISLSNLYGFSFSDISLEANNGNCEIVLGNSNLCFMKNQNLNSISLEDVRFDIVNNKFKLNEIKLKSDTLINLLGIDLALSKLTMEDDLTVNLIGTVSFDNSFPDFLQHSIIDAKLNFNKENGKDINIETYNMNELLSPSIKTLEIQTSNIYVKNNASGFLDVLIEGDIYTTKEAPIGKQNTKMKINQFIFNCNDKKIQILSASSSDFQIEIKDSLLSDLTDEIIWSFNSDTEE